MLRRTDLFVRNSSKSVLLMVSLVDMLLDRDTVPKGDSIVYTLEYTTCQILANESACSKRVLHPLFHIVDFSAMMHPLPPQNTLRFNSTSFRALRHIDKSKGPRRHGNVGFPAAPPHRQ